MFSAAIKNSDTAFEWHKKNGNTNGMFFTVFLSSWIYQANGNYDKAFEFARKSLDIATQINNNSFKLLVFEAIGELFRAIEDYETAMQYFSEASENAKPDAAFHTGLSILLHQYDSAKYYFNLINTDTANQENLRVYLEIAGEYYFAQKPARGDALAGGSRVLHARADGARIRGDTAAPGRGLEPRQIGC